MPITEIFPQPTVKQVMFGIWFPNLFYIESKIGDFQIQVMPKFPKSSLLIKNKYVVTDAGKDIQIDEMDNELSDKSNKIWQFQSDNGYEIRVKNDRLIILSNEHKSFKIPLGNNEDNFLQIIKYSVEAFRKVVNLPIINKIGLRYIDECPVPHTNNEVFKNYYNTSFPIDRFDINSSSYMEFKIMTQKNSCLLNYTERLSKTNDEQFKLILDFDSRKEIADINNYLNDVDELHTLIANEYEQTLRKPAFEMMRHNIEEEVK